MTRLAAALAAAWIALAMLAAPALAQEDDPTDEPLPPSIGGNDGLGGMFDGMFDEGYQVEPCDPDSGVASLLSDDPGPQVTSHLWSYGTCGFAIHSDYGGWGAAEWAKRAGHTIASFLWSIGVVAVAVVTALHQWTADLSLSDLLAPVVADFTTALEPVWQPVFVLAVVAGAALVAVRAWRGQTAQLFGWLLFAVAIAGFSLILFRDPVRVIDGPVAAAQTVRAGMMEAAARALPQSPYSGPSGVGQVVTDPDPDEWALHHFSRQMSDVYVYRPYKALQFGSEQVPDQLVDEVLGASAYTRGEVEQIRANPESAEPVDERHQERFDAAVDRLEAEHPIEYAHFTGAHVHDQIVTAAVAGLSGVAGSILHALVALAVMVADIAAMLVWSVAALALMVAPFASWGRRVFFTWAGRLVAALVVQVVMSVVQLIDLVFTGTLLANAGQFGGYVPVALLALVITLLIWRARKPLMEAGRVNRDVDPNRYDATSRATGAAKRGAGTVARTALTAKAVTGGVVAGRLLTRNRDDDGDPTDAQALPAGATRDGERVEVPAGAPGGEITGPSVLAFDGDGGVRTAAAAGEGDGLEQPDEVVYVQGEPRQLTPAAVGQPSGLPRVDDLPFGQSHHDQGPQPRLGEGSGRFAESYEPAGASYGPAGASYEPAAAPPPHAPRMTGPAVDQPADPAQVEYRPADPPATVQTGQPPRVDPPPPPVDTTRHRPPSDPAGMPDWPRQPDRIDEPDTRAAHDRDRAEAMARYQRWQDDYEQARQAVDPPPVDYPDQED